MAEKRAGSLVGARGCVPLGVTGTGRDTIFAVQAPDSKAGQGPCDLLLYRRGEKDPERRIPMSRLRGSVWTAIPGIDTIADYDYKYETDGIAFTDPYAALVRGNENFGAVCPETRGGILKEAYDWEGDAAPDIPSDGLILYKLHVRGFTMQRSSKITKKGTFRGIVQKLPYLKELGINAVLLMPCTEFLEAESEKRVVGHSPEFRRMCLEYPQANETERLLRNQLGEREEAARLNYWGYGAKSWYFAPKASYASDPSEPSGEMMDMVKALHRENIEVWMEFFFPKEISPVLIVDCLRYWSAVYHIDGFQISGDRVPYSVLSSDPYLKDRKLVADWWPEGEDGERRLMNYGREFSCRSRRFLKGDNGQVRDFYESYKANPKDRGLLNYIADHDGFTLGDLYSYEEKHNQANGEDNRDGCDSNYSWNCGAEGKTRKETIRKLRLRMVKNALAALFLAQGTPLLYAGDERLNSQNGNNNAYCQDNETGWVDWTNQKAGQEIFEFTKQLIRIRKETGLFGTADGFNGTDNKRTGRPDISVHGTKAWFPDYAEYSHALGILLNGAYSPAGTGDRYLVFNMHWEALEFDLPKAEEGTVWQIVLATAGEETPGQVVKGNRYRVPGRSVIVFAGVKAGKERKCTNGVKVPSEQKI